MAGRLTPGRSQPGGAQGEGQLQDANDADPPAESGADLNIQLEALLEGALSSVVALLRPTLHFGK